VIYLKSGLEGNLNLSVEILTIFQTFESLWFIQSGFKMDFVINDMDKSV